MAILLITVAVPAALWGAQGIQSLSSDESYFSPYKLEDFEGDFGVYGENDVDGNVRTKGNIYDYRYMNSSSYSVENSGLYTSNKTGNDYHEFLAPSPSDYSYFISLNFGLNRSIDDAINNDLNGVTLTAEFDRNATLDLSCYVVAQSAEIPDEGQSYYELSSKTINVSTSFEEYHLDIDYSRLLEADSEYGDYSNNLCLNIANNATGETGIEPADSLKFNIDLIHSTSSVSNFWTMNVVAGISGIFLFPAAIFSTPWVDLKDLTGGKTIWS